MKFARQKSAGVSDRAHSGDRRAVETRARLDRALVELLYRRSYDNIRVSDITRKARVGRATYYAHYSSKHALLRSQFNRIIAPMLRPKRDDPCRVDCTKLFEHVKTEARLYEALMKGSADRGGARILRECLGGRIRQLLEPPSRSAAFDISTSMITGFVASSLLAILEEWVLGGARETPAEMQGIFRRLVGCGLAGSALKA